MSIKNIEYIKTKEKLTKSIIYICINIVLVIFFNISNVKAMDYSIEEYTINATILSNSNMKVEELIKYDFDEKANGVYRDLLYKYNFSSQNDDMDPTSLRYQANSIINIKAYSSDISFDNMQQAILEEEELLSNGINGYFSVTDLLDDGYRKEIKVYTPTNADSKKYIKYTYEIEDVAVKYDDACEIYWNFLGDDWQCEINNLNININFENDLNMENVLVFPHSYIGNLSYTINDNLINIKAAYVPQNRALDARIVFDSNVLDFATKRVYSSYDFDKLYDIEKVQENAKIKYFISNYIYGAVVVLAVILFVVILIKVNKELSKGKKSKKQLEIYTDILDNLSLSKYSSLNYKGYGISNTNLLLATILDLSNRNYIILDAKKKVKKKAFDSIDYEYFMKLNQNKDYSTLDEYEINVINYLFDLKIGNKTDISEFKSNEIELNARLKELSKNTKQLSKYSRFCNEKNVKDQDELFNKPLKENIRFAIFGIVVLVVILLINTLVISPLNFSDKSIAIFISVFFLAIYTIFSLALVCTARSIKEMYIDEYNKLKGLEKYLKEYSLLKERYPIEFKLWSRYLVFAALFGIADKVSKEFKEELILTGYDEEHIYMTYPLINMSINSTSISSSFATSIGMSSSGGYSSVGSGGGGGRRRRWRRLLKIIFMILCIF